MFIIEATFFNFCLNAAVIIVLLLILGAVFGDYLK